MADEQRTTPDTLEMFISSPGLVEAGARILYSLRAGCTPGDILDILAEEAGIDTQEYRERVLGVLVDADGSGDFKL